MLEISDHVSKRRCDQAFPGDPERRGSGLGAVIGGGQPGITGLWQLRRTREPGLDFQEWIRYDFEYVEKTTFWFDLKILLLTVLAVVFPKNAV